MPLVTVGLPFFDEHRHLGNAIRSVLAQTFSDFELLLVDDGSRDGSLDLARSFRDPRITVIADGERRHLPARLNEIVRRARGSYVARMDADDMMHPTRLARQLAVFDDQPSSDVVGSWIALIDGDGTPFAAVEALPPTALSAVRYSSLPHPTVMARRSWFIDNAYDETLTRAEDRDLWCRSAVTSRFVVIPECLYAFRVDSAKRSFLASYLEGQRQNRVIYRKYGPQAVGRPETVRLVAVAHAKSLVMRALSRTGLVERLVRRRGRPLTDHERSLAMEAIAAGSQRE
jgi:glycosyltransferase involved in cell wall biosynthesis